MKQLAVCVLVSCAGLGVQASAQRLISTVAGNGAVGFSGDGGPATAAQLWLPSSVAVDASGNLYIADYGNNRVREVTAGVITTIAGNGTAGFSGDGGPATSASLYFPSGVAVDAAGNVYIAESAESLVLEVSVGGTINTFAGDGVTGFAGDGGVATSAQLNLGVSSGIAVDSAGNVYIADSGNNRIRRVSVSGVITTVAGNGSAAYTGDSGVATSASLNGPVAVAVDASGNLYIADAGNNVVRKVSTSGIITTVAGNGTAGFSGDGGRATSAQLWTPSGVAVDHAGNLYIADYGNYRIRLVSAGTISTIAGNGTEAYAGDGGPATAASLAPAGIASDALGNLFIADQNNNRIREVSIPAVQPPPSITTGGVVPVYSNVTTIEPTEWVSIYGTNLARGTATWNGNFPTSLGGTSVTIDGKPGYIWFVSPTQINVQAPDDSTLGLVPVVVTTPGGTFTSTVTLAETAPQFSLLDNRHVAGIILRSDQSGAYGGGTYDILGPTGTSLGYPTVAAKAGDNVELFGVGFGPTTPSILAGQPFSGAAPTNKTVVLRINFQNVTPTFSGLVSAGLYQINFTVPAGLGTGDVLLTATAGVGQTPLDTVISLQ
jgi:uncharacterized protein (TIGR03437 family)